MDRGERASERLGRGSRSKSISSRPLDSGAARAPLVGRVRKISAGPGRRRRRRRGRRGRRKEKTKTKTKTKT